PGERPPLPLPPHGGRGPRWSPRALLAGAPLAGRLDPFLRPDRLQEDARAHARRGRGGGPATGGLRRRGAGRDAGGLRPPPRLPRRTRAGHRLPRWTVTPAGAASTFRVKLLPLTPLVVGSGRTLGRFDYTVTVNPRSGAPLLRMIDTERFIEESPLDPAKKTEA